MVEQARSVSIERSQIANYASGLEAVEDAGTDPLWPPGGDREARAAFAVCLNAINFGSGWWPTIRKRSGQSGFFTIATGLSERFAADGPWSADQLVALTPAELGAVLGQDPEHPLMALFADSLRDVGEHLRTDHDGRFATAIDSAAGSAPALAALFAAWEAFTDVSIYRERSVPLYKRAQLAAADVGRCGAAQLRDLDRLTAFADNLVPHVLRVDEVLRLDAGLAARIEAEELLIHDSPEEVELRACAVHAVELLAAARPDLIPAEIDAALWNRGRGPRYKALPRPRSRTTAY